MIYKNQTQARKETGVRYLGSVNLSAKHFKAYKYKELTYALYLSPAKSSGYEVCPMRTSECTKLCLHESGHNRIDCGKINISRFKKTKLFFENREYFMHWLIDEINSAKAKAKKMKHKFSVRLNNTSDLSPKQFTLGGKNILEIFPDVQFYDYTKVFSRAKLLKYPNYDLTFSYSGQNLGECMRKLKSGGRVAMVFDKVPKTFLGYKVIDGDKYDMRYYDKPGLVGLKYKKVRRKMKTSFVLENV